MNKKKLDCLVKKITAGVLAVGMVVGGIMIVPEQADAAIVADKVIYEEGYDITKLWDATNPQAPVKAGYVFGGWYSAKAEDAYLTKEAAATATTAYAKFVPAQVLSVKAQNMEGTGTDASITSTHVRIISSLDSKNYAKVGFDIYLANSVQLYKGDVEGEPLETDKIYDGLLVGKEKKEHASEIFGGVSRYVSVWQLENIDNDHWGKIIYVRPYWITKDGTKVQGLAEYVHIEDEYKGYVSVPVNLLNKEVAAQVAAGKINMTYSNAEDKEVALKFKKVEAGRMLPEMNATANGNVIQMVGNAINVDDYNSNETLYANIRFEKPQGTETADVDVDFEMTIGQFCNWKEEDVDMDETEKWDVKYYAQKTVDK